MALTLVATAGASNANSYATVSDGNTYHEAHLYADTWNEASATQQAQALVWATRMLDDHFDWIGTVASQTQALRWPRIGAYDRDGRLLSSSTIPTALVHATAELARSLLTSDPTDTSTDSGAVQYVTVGTIAVRYASGTVATPTVIADSVQDMLSHLGTYRSGTSGAITMRRG